MTDTAAEAVVSVRLFPIADLSPNPRNARTHPAEQVAQIAASIKEFGFTNPILADVDDDGIIAAGHGRRLAVLKLMEAGDTIRLPNGRALPKGMVPIIDCSGWSESQRRAYTLADNRLAETSEWDDELLKLELVFLQEDGFDLDLTGFDAKALEKLLALPEDDPAPDTVAARATLAQRFGIPPFSVLNAREGWWQERKRAWLALGIQSEVGRGENLLRFSDTINQPDPKKRKAKDEKAAASSGTSIFDPVLCELSYRWFSPPGGVILDPFAGGSVRGIVASELGRQYVGCDLRAEQVEANREQAAKICGDPLPIWHIGDSRAIETHAEGTEADFVFSCPPYADLEVYSDDPKDLSTLNYPEFRKAYTDIIGAACAMLKPDRFAAFVIGEVRDKKGNYYGFVPDTIRAFEEAGLRFYNEIILVTAAGSLPIRAGKQFATTRKVGKTHQNVLVFVKGDPKKATEAIGECEFGEIGEAEPADQEWGEKL